MVIKKIFAVRHGDIEYPLDSLGRKLVYPPETRLSDLGRMQIEKVGKKLENKGIEVLFVSPFIRTKESAGILESILKTRQVIILDQLKDVYPNSWTGKPLEDYAKTGGDIYSNPLSKDQETLTHLVSRAKEALEIIVKDDRFTSIGIVSHGDLLSALDWGLKFPDRVPSYQEMKTSFYLQKGQVAVYSIDPELRITDEVRIITVDEVSQSRESYR